MTSERDRKKIPASIHLSLSWHSPSLWMPLLHACLRLAYEKRCGVPWHTLLGSRCRALEILNVDAMLHALRILDASATMLLLPIAMLLRGVSAAA